MKAQVIILGIVIFCSPHLHVVQAKNSEQSEKEKKANNIGLVLKYGNYSQVKQTLKRLQKLKYEEKKKFKDDIIQLMELNNTDIHKLIIKFIQNYEDTSLDKYLLKFLESDKDQVFLLTCNAIEKKSLHIASPVFVKILQEFDYTTSNIRIPDSIRLAGVLKIYSLENFLFDKLQDKKTLNDYKPYLIGFFTKIQTQKQPILEYLLSLLGDKETDMVIRQAVASTFSQLKHPKAKPVLKSVLTEINALESPDAKKKYTQLRYGVITALVGLKEPNATKNLLQMAREENTLGRLYAIKIMKQHFRNSFGELLEYMSQHDPNEKIRSKAKKALLVVRK